MSAIYSNHPVVKRTSKGFTLIEVLIALLVLAIGLVGIAALHLSGLRNAHSSYYTSVASSVALDFEERLWLAMADVDAGCLGGVDIDDILSDLEGTWGSGQTGTVTIPGLTVTRDGFREDPSGDDYWVEASITVRWEDGRFGQPLERFPYTARVVCAPPPPPPTP